MLVEVIDQVLFKSLSVVVSDGIEKVNKINNDRKFFKPTVYKYPKLSNFPSGIPSIREVVQDKEKPIDYKSYFRKFGEAPYVSVEELNGYNNYFEYAYNNKFFKKSFELEVKANDFDYLNFEVRYLTINLIDRYITMYGENTPFETELFRRIYVPLENGIMHDELPVDIYIPILFLSFNIDEEYVLNERTSIVKMDDLFQKSRFSIQSYTAGVSTSVMGAATHALVLKGYSVKDGLKITSGEIFNKLTSYPTNIIDKFFNAIRIGIGAKCGYSQLIGRPMGWTDSYNADLIPLKGTAVREYPIEFDNYRWLEPAEHINKDDLEKIKGLFVSLLDTTKNKIEVATHRLKECYLRKNEQDAVLDAIIGLETLLADGERSEITHKLALRSAFLLQKSDKVNESPLEIFKKVKAIYSYRSAIIHGSTKLDSRREIKINEKENVPALDVAISYLRSCIEVLILYPEYLQANKIDEGLILGR